MTNLLYKLKKPKNSSQLLLSTLNIVGPIAGVVFTVTMLSCSIISRQPQQLPISAVAQIGSEKIQLEVAQTPEELAKGLKFRKQLPQNTGMLFELGKSVEKAPFWMKDVHIPLDILFLQDGVVKTIVQSAPPCSKESCKIYYSTEPVHQVLELSAGSVARMGVKEGATLRITDKTRG